MEWKRPPTTPKADFHPKKVMLCTWWDWKGVLYYELLPENQMINSNKYCSQLDQLKAVLYEKRLESVNREHIIFYEDNARPYISLMTTQKLFSLAGKFWFIHCIHQTLHLQMPFWSLQNSLNGKISIPWKTIKGT